MNEIKPGPNNVSKMANEYVEKNGWVLVPLRQGEKMPRREDWSLPEKCLGRPTLGQLPVPDDLNGVGLAHRYSRTVSIDLDDLKKAKAYFANYGEGNEDKSIDIQAYIDDPLSLKLISGKPNRSKLIYRLPPDVTHLQSVKRDSDGFELRCATRNGKTLQDVLPPSIHPGTGKAYSWEGDYTKVPMLPTALFDFWNDLLERRKTKTWDIPNIDVLTTIVESALAAMSPDREYNDWLAIGMALDSVGLGDLWDDWSSEGADYKPGDCCSRLAGFGDGGGVTIGTFFHYAREAGWKYGDAWRAGVEDVAGMSDYKEALGILALLIKMCHPTSGETSQAFNRVAKSFNGITKKDIMTDIKSEMELEDEKDLNLGHLEIADLQWAAYDSPVCVDGSVWSYKTDRWVETSYNKLVDDVGRNHGDQKLCRTAGNYNAVAKLLVSKEPQPDFFKNKGAPGVAFEDGYYNIQGDKMMRSMKRKEHRTRYTYETTPAEGPHPFLDQLLECMAEDSRALLQEFIGVVIFGEATRFQKCMLLYGASGTGKSLLINLLQRIIPKTSTVPPAKFDEDYWRAALAGSMLNTYTELPSGKDIDSSEFKAIVAGDKISARQIHQPTFEFLPMAGHIFSSNHLPTVGEAEPAFWRRWLLVEYVGAPTVNDPDVVNKILEEELSAFYYWALSGAKRVFERRGYKTGATHEKVLAMWGDRHDLVKQCLYADDSPFIFEEKAWIKTTDFKRLLRSWCKINDLKSPPASEIISVAERNLGKPNVKDGYKIFRGIGERMDDSENRAGFQG